ncbi:MAG: hypothetical protein ABR980_12075 [Ignavibacteriaceae bacterium]|jgi:peptidoglycan hydrolase CwlO-like protein
MTKNIIQFASLIVMALILTLAIPVSTLAQGKKGDDEIKSLVNRIDALEKKVKEQDTIIANLNNKLDKINNPILAIPNIQDWNNLPKGSKPFQFNGQTYYMVPIKSSTDVK